VLIKDTRQSVVAPTAHAYKEAATASEGILDLLEELGLIKIEEPAAAAPPRAAGWPGTHRSYRCPEPAPGPNWVLTPASAKPAAVSFAGKAALEGLAAATARPLHE
jgi:hypothetical protein